MDDSGEQSKEKKSDQKKTSNELDTRTNPANDEIMLNGKRYKLVGPTEETTTPSPKTSITEMNSISNLISRMLKSQPTQVPVNGEPISLASNQNMMSNTNQMVPFNTPPTTTVPPFQVTQQQKYPVLPNKTSSMNLVRKGISTVKTGDDTVKYGMNAVRHGMNLAGNSQPMVQQSYQKDAFVQQQETAIAAARALAAQQQLSTVYPVYPGSGGSGQLEPFNSGSRSKEVMPQPEEQVFLVNNGAFRPIPLRGIQSMKKGYAEDTRRKEEVFQEVGQSLTQVPFRRQYSLKELEVFYNNQKSKLTDNLKSSREISTNQRVYPPLKQLKIGQMTSMEDFNHKKMTRLEKLRRQFAQERAIVARRTKNMFLNRANANNNQEKTNGKVTEHHCQNIRSFARQFGTLDVEFFAKNNCRFIETYYPDLKCSKVNEYLAECQKYF
uniref:aECM cysteine-cradle domain-containing protein n=1 Tax=Ditylenchus dipsaci TaxID=166011 RepID=A0A915EDD0_9BILA